ncbi:MAG: KilA-N domain-containing protein, partial [Candidatus Polarisedimenticolia bacterium]
MTTNDIASKALVYNGAVIRDRNEMLSLTDMWKAQGADPARQPANWLASADAKRFIETLNVLEPGNSGVQSR